MGQARSRPCRDKNRPAAYITPPHVFRLSNTLVAGFLTIAAVLMLLSPATGIL